MRLSKLLFFLLPVALVAYYFATLPAPKPVGIQRASTIRAILKATGDHLGRMQKPEGNYFYEYNPFTGKYTSDDNMVRQVGSLYGISMLYEALGDPVYLERIKKTADYWLARSGAVEREGKMLRYFGTVIDAKVGTAGLFIVGTRTLKAHAPDWWKTNEAKIREVENFLFWMEKSSGGFAEKFTASTTQEQKDQTAASDYFDGEVLLAFVTMYNDTPDQKTRDVIYRTLGYFENVYTKTYAKGLYLWAMTAMNKAYALFKDERFADFADRQEKLKSNIRPLIKRSRSHNICTDLEGMGNWLVMKKTQGIEKKKYEEYLAYTLSQMSRMQVRKNKRMKVRLDGERTLRMPIEDSAGGFLTDFDEPVQRIDFQQHCIGAFKARLDFLE